MGKIESPLGEQSFHSTPMNHYVVDDESGDQGYQGQPQYPLQQQVPQQHSQPPHAADVTR